MQTEVIEVFALVFNTFKDALFCFWVGYPVVEVVFSLLKVCVGGSKGFEQIENLNAVFDALLRVHECDLAPLVLIRAEEAVAAPALVIGGNFPGEVVHVC